MTDAVLAALTEIRRAHETPADAIALSLSCEFLARAAFDRSELVRTLGLISPTGFEGWARDHEGGTRGQKWLHRTLSFRLWSRGLFRLLTTRAVIRKFLKKTWGSKTIDAPLLHYASRHPSTRCHRNRPAISVPIHRGHSQTSRTRDGLRWT